MSTFALSTTDNYAEVIGALNYALSNLGSTSANVNTANVLVANVTTGVISSVNSSGQTQVPVISYLYNYVNVKYANSASGSSGFTSNSAYANYYGVHNTVDGSISNNPADYNWTQVSGGFGATKQLYYAPGGGNTINFSVATSTPSKYYTPVIDNTAILLSLIGNSAVVANSIQPQAITNVQIASNTIQGQNIQLGTITANLIAANTIFVSQSLQSTNATFDNPNSNGFWLDATNGSARFGSSINIGDSLIVGNNASIANNLTVGNNATIGNNLTVGGLVTTGNLNANTVITSTIVPQSVSLGNAASSTTLITILNPAANNPYIYYPANVSITTPAQTTGFGIYINGVLNTDENVDVTGGNTTWILTFYLYKNGTSILAQTYRYDASLNTSRLNNIVPFTYFDTFVAGSTTYTYSIGITVSPGGTYFPQLLLKSGTLVCQVLKR